MNLNARAKFVVDDFRAKEFDDEAFDIVLYHSSLHHFRNLDEILLKTKRILKTGGFLIINEYVGQDRFLMGTRSTFCSQ